MKTATQSTFDVLAKSVKSVNETIEAGVNPEKSLKRKFEEYQEQQRVEDQQKEAERLQKEQEERERQQVTMVIHPYNGQQMYLTGEQRDQFFRDMAAVKPTDFKCIYESWYPYDSESSTRVCPIFYCPGFSARASKVNSTLKVK